MPRDSDSLALRRKTRHARRSGQGALTLAASGSLEIAFDSRELRSICESEAEARRELGQDLSAALQRRLADLRASRTLDDLPVGPPREVEDQDLGHISLELGHGGRLVFAPNNPTPPTTPEGKPDLSRISRIKILRIEREDG